MNVLAASGNYPMNIHLALHATLFTLEIKLSQGSQVFPLDLYLHFLLLLLSRRAGTESRLLLKRLLTNAAVINLNLLVVHHTNNYTAAAERAHVKKKEPYETVKSRQVHASRFYYY